MSELREFCTFHLDDLLLGVEANRVQEVIRHQHMTPVPLASRVVEGLINLRGQIVTALDLRQGLGLAPRTTDKSPTNVVVQGNGETVSLLVDDAGDVVQVHEDTFEKVPDTFRGPARELVRGVYKLEKGLLLALDPEKAVQLGFEASKNERGRPRQGDAR